MDEAKDAGIAKLFGANMKRLREKKGWLQTDLAKHLQSGGLPKYSQVAVSRTEEGNRTVRLDEALVIAKVLDVTIEQLLEPADSLSKRLEIANAETNKIYSLRLELSRLAQEYEKQRMESRKILEGLLATEGALDITDAQNEMLKSEMRSALGATRSSAVAAVQPFALNHDGESWPIRKPKEASNGND